MVWAGRGVGGGPTLWPGLRTPQGTGVTRPQKTISLSQDRCLEVLIFDFILQYLWWLLP